MNEQEIIRILEGKRDLLFKKRENCKDENEKELIDKELKKARRDARIASVSLQKRDEANEQIAKIDVSLARLQALEKEYLAELEELVANKAEGHRLEGQDISELKNDINSIMEEYRIKNELKQKLLKDVKLYNGRFKRFEEKIKNREAELKAELKDLEEEWKEEYYYRAVELSGMEEDENDDSGKLTQRINDIKAELGVMEPAKPSTTTQNNTTVAEQEKLQESTVISEEKETEPEVEVVNTEVKETKPVEPKKPFRERHPKLIKFVEIVKTSFKSGFTKLKDLFKRKEKVKKEETETVEETKPDKVTEFTPIVEKGADIPNITEQDINPTYKSGYEASGSSVPKLDMTRLLSGYYDEEDRRRKIRAERFATLSTTDDGTSR